MKEHTAAGFDAATPLDEVTAERLLRGLDPADAPPGYGAVAELLAGLRIEARDSELAGSAVVDRMAEVIGTGGRRRRGLSRRTASKVLVIAAASTVGLGGVAAAANGSLPPSIQGIVSRAASPVVHFPEGRHDTDTPIVTVSPAVTTASPSTAATTAAGAVVSGNGIAAPLASLSPGTDRTCSTRTTSAGEHAPTPHATCTTSAPGSNGSTSGGTGHSGNGSDGGGNGTSSRTPTSRDPFDNGGDSGSGQYPGRTTQTSGTAPTATDRSYGGSGTTTPTTTNAHHSGKGD